MKLVIATLFLMTLAGCSSLSLKRCDGPAQQADLWHCPESVQGSYRACQKPVDLYQGCVTPQ